MALRSVLELVLRTKKRGRGVREAQKELGAFDKLLNGFSVAMATLPGVALAAGAAMKKAFDLGREGAVIAQTTESFGLLLEKVEASPDLLEDLRRAARGTVSDMELMSSTATLLAGASGDLAPALAAATPELLEIAKAANKLNPALGDTTFLYQSLATGVKRASPLILDNLGLTIRIGEANERFAESLGKSVNELTTEEQKMALLNETLRSGRVLIDQVGGSIESQTDAYDRLATSITNIIDLRKKEAAEGLTPVVDALADELGFRFQLFEAVNKDIISKEEQIDLLIAVRRGTLSQAEALEELSRQTEEHEQALQADIHAGHAQRELMLQVADANLEAADSVRVLGGESEEARAEVLALADAAAERVGPSFSSMAEAVGLAATAVDTNLTGSISRFLEQMEFFIAGGAEIQTAFLSVQQALQEGAITPEQAQEFAGELFVAATALEEDLGELDAAEAAEKIQEQLGGSLEDAKGRLAELNEGLLGLPDRIEIEIAYITSGDVFGGDFQAGGQFQLPGGRSQAVPVAFTGHGGETVTITPAGQMPPEVTENFNLTIQSQARSEDVEASFELMRAIRGGGF